MNGMGAQIIEPRNTPEYDIGRKIKLATIVQVVEAILQFRSPLSQSDTLYMPLNDHLLPVVLEANRRYYQTHNNFSKALI
jgi:hypothetical protein